jgi:hypothetical protein
MAELAREGDKAPDGLVTPDVDVAVPVAPALRVLRLGFPKRSTPSLAADMMAEPSMEASKREGITAAAVVLRPRPWDTEPVAVAEGPWREARIGLLCWRLDA